MSHNLYTGKNGTEIRLASGNNFLMAGNGPNPGACDRPYRRDRRGRSD